MNLHSACSFEAFSAHFHTHTHGSNDLRIARVYEKYALSPASGVSMKTHGIFGSLPDAHTHVFILLNCFLFPDYHYHHFVTVMRCLLKNQ